MSHSSYPTLDDANTAHIAVVNFWYQTLPRPTTDEEMDVIERICLRHDGCQGEKK